MRTIRIYQPGHYQAGHQLELSREAAQHVAVVLRMQPGEQVTLFSGDGQEFLAIIASVKKKQVIVNILSAQPIDKESPLSIHLGQAISKGDRMEWVMQKATELGVASITPLITERCAVKLDKERLAKKQQQWQSIVIAACEQSGRNLIPAVHSPVSFESYIKDAPATAKYLIHPVGNKTWRDYELNQKDLTLLIGPEGGFTDVEVIQALQQDFLPLSLGPRILRTETAAITALSVLQAVCGDL